MAPLKDHDAWTIGNLIAEIFGALVVIALLAVPFVLASCGNYQPPGAGLDKVLEETLKSKPEEPLLVDPNAGAISRMLKAEDSAHVP